ncbi:hypothetical protein CL656_02425 [bacterium]|nr:hypothetical protein [bacterium]
MTELSNRGFNKNNEKLNSQAERFKSNTEIETEISRKTYKKIKDIGILRKENNLSRFLLLKNEGNLIKIINFIKSNIESLKNEKYPNYIKSNLDQYENTEDWIHLINYLFEISKYNLEGQLYDDNKIKILENSLNLIKTLKDVDTDINYKNITAIYYSFIEPTFGQNLQNLIEYDFLIKDLLLDKSNHRDYSSYLYYLNSTLENLNRYEKKDIQNVIGNIEINTHTQFTNFLSILHFIKNDKKNLAFNSWIETYHKENLKKILEDENLDPIKLLKEIFEFKKNIEPENIQKEYLERARNKLKQKIEENNKTQKSDLTIESDSQDSDLETLSENQKDDSDLETNLEYEFDIDEFFKEIESDSQDSDLENRIIDTESSSEFDFDGFFTPPKRVFEKELPVELKEAIEKIDEPLNNYVDSKINTEHLPFFKKFIDYRDKFKEEFPKLNTLTTDVIIKNIPKFELVMNCSQEYLESSKKIDTTFWHFYMRDFISKIFHCENKIDDPTDWLNCIKKMNQTLSNILDIDIDTYWNIRDQHFNNLEDFEKHNIIFEAILEGIKNKKTEYTEFLKLNHKAIAKNLSIEDLKHNLEEFYNKIQNRKKSLKNDRIKDYYQELLISCSDKEFKTIQKYEKQIKTSHTGIIYNLIGSNYNFDKLIKNTVKITNENDLKQIQINLKHLNDKKDLQKILINSSQLNPGLTLKFLTEFRVKNLYQIQDNLLNLSSLFKELDNLNFDITDLSNIINVDVYNEDCKSKTINELNGMLLKRKNLIFQYKENRNEITENRLHTINQKIKTKINEFVIQEIKEKQFLEEINQINLNLFNNQLTQEELDKLKKYPNITNILELKFYQLLLEGLDQDEIKKLFIKSLLNDSSQIFNEENPYNKKFIKKMIAKGINMDKWLNGVQKITQTINGEEISIEHEINPYEVFQMGNYVQKTCFNINSGRNAYPLAYAISANTQVLYAKHKGKIISRQAIVLTSEGKIFVSGKYSDQSSIGQEVDFTKMIESIKEQINATDIVKRESLKNLDQLIFKRLMMDNFTN